MKNILYILAALPLLLSSCNKESGTPEPSTTAVQFSTAITRATGTSWGDTDEIGVFMMNAGTSLTTACLASNVLYTNSASGFTTATPIYYPETGAVDFVAYYPYRATPGTDPYIYKVDVSNQSDPTKIDLLYSNDATSKTSTTPTVPLKFSHKLSKLVLSVVKGNGISDAEFSGIGIVITGMPTTADFALADGTFANRTDVTDIAPELIEDKYEAIVIPQAAGTPGRSIGFTVGGQVFSYLIPAAAEFVEGKTYAYTVTVSRTGIAVSVGDVTWTSGGTETGTAILYYEVGDYFPDRNVVLDINGNATSGVQPIGIVFRAKTAAQKGLVVSLNEATNTKWGPVGAITNAINIENGAVNMETIKALDDDLSDYPALKWCADKGAGWYLPAQNELSALYAAWNGGTGEAEQNNMRTTFNGWLKAAGGMELTPNRYWSSSEIGNFNAWSVHFDFGYTGNDDKDYDDFTVRAVLAF